jgi:methylenetetrahydrofolate reductase (NADPH)
MFFDNQQYFNFVDHCRAEGINVPIVPGLKPLTKKYQLNAIPRIFHLNIPQEFSDALLAAKDSKARQQVGIEWTVAQSKELKAAGVPCLHYYTMGDVDTIKEIVAQIY